MNKGLQTLIDRGFVKDCTDFDGLSDLMDREPVTFYCGVDPTGPSLHVGHIVPFFAMQQSTHERKTVKGIVYRYQKGYTCAVRQPATIRDLF